MTIPKAKKAAEPQPKRRVANRAPGSRLGDFLTRQRAIAAQKHAGEDGDIDAAGVEVLADLAEACAMDQDQYLSVIEAGAAGITMDQAHAVAEALAAYGVTITPEQLMSLLESPTAEGEPPAADPEAEPMNLRKPPVVPDSPAAPVNDQLSKEAARLRRECARLQAENDRLAPLAEHGERYMADRRTSLVRALTLKHGVQAMTKEKRDAIANASAGELDMIEMALGEDDALASPRSRRTEHRPYRSSRPALVAGADDADDDDADPESLPEPRNSASRFNHAGPVDRDTVCLAAQAYRAKKGDADMSLLDAVQEVARLSPTEIRRLAAAG